MTHRAAVAIAVALLALPPSQAWAADVTSAEFQGLVRRAVESEAALEELRSVDHVDGRAVDMEIVLEGASDGDLEQRLAALRSEFAITEPRGDPNQQARDILSDGRYRDSEPPRPLKGVTEWIDERLEGVGRSVTDFITRVLPGGMALFWVLMVLIVVLVTIVLSLRYGARGTRGRADDRWDTSRRSREDPGQLERSADRAEAEGDLETSIRLRFRAGVLRLANRGVLPRWSSVTSEEISEALGSPTFDQVAATFDRVVYGHQSATKRDVDESRRGWGAIVKEAGT